MFLKTISFDKVPVCFLHCTKTYFGDKTDPLTGFTCCHRGGSGQPTYQCSHPQKSDPSILQPVQTVSEWCGGGNGLCTGLGDEMWQSTEKVGILTYLISNVSWFSTINLIYFGSMTLIYFGGFPCVKNTYIFFVCLVVSPSSWVFWL